MTTARRLVRNTVSLSAVSALRMVVGFSLTVYIGRRLGPVWLGKYALLLAYVSIFQLASEFGLPRLVSREVARAPELASTSFWTSVILQLGSSLAGMAVMVGVVALMGYPADTSYMLFLATFALPLWALAGAAGALLRASERMELLTLAEALGGAAQIGTAILMLQAGYGAVSLAASQVASVGMVALVSLACVFALGMVQKPQLSRDFTRWLLREVSDLSLLAIFGGVLFRLDVLVLARLLDEQAIGIYNAAYQMVKIPMLLAMAYGDAIFPALARFHHAARERFQVFVRGSLRYGILLLFPLAVVVGPLAPTIIRLVFAGEEYVQAATVLRWLVWLAIPFYAYTVLSRSLVASDRQADARRVAGIMVVGGLALQILMTTRWGVVGAAIAAGLTFLIGAILGARYVMPEQLRFALGTDALRFLATALGMLAVLWALRLQSPVLAATVSVGGYVLLALLFSVFAHEDLVMLRRAFPGGDGTEHRSSMASTAPNWRPSEPAPVAESGAQSSSLHNQVQAFYDRDAESYPERRWFRNATTLSDYDSTLQALLAALEPNPGHRILEIGCGAGTWTDIIAPACAELVALDISEGMLGRARSTVRWPNVQFVHADFMRWETPGVFDSLFSVRVFEHLEDKDAALQRMLALLRPGGKAVIITKTVPSIWNGRVRMNRWLRRILRRPPSATGFAKPTSFWMARMTPWNMLQGMRSAGFAQAEVASAIWRLPICAGGESEYPLVRGRFEEPVLQVQRWIAASIRRGPHLARLLGTLGAESYVAWAWKPGQ